MHPTSRRPHIAPLPPASPEVAVRLFHRRPRPGALVAWALVGLAVLLLTATRAGAAPQEQDAATAGDSPIGKRQFLGSAKRDGAVVRAGPSVGDLSVMTLTQGQEVVVVDAVGDFLRILPPEGAYCLVAKARVDLRGNADGPRKPGRINVDANVRAGSRINSTIGATAARLAKGEEVTVIGEDGAGVYYQILPPRDVFFYVARSELQPVREVLVRETAGGWSVDEKPAALAEGGNAPGNGEPLAQNDPAGAGERTDDLQESADEVAPPANVPPTTPEQVAEATKPAPPAPTTRPAAEARFREIDARYIEAAQRPLEEQPLESLKQEYDTLLAEAKADPALAALVPLVEARVQTIALRQEALQDLQAIQAMRQQMDQRQKSLDAEQSELAERAKDAKVVVYAAVGQLQPSSLQVGGGGTLYRLCDPATGRTLIYLRAEGEQATALTRHLEQFVGVKGEQKNDADLKLKFIAVAEVAAVDARQLFKGVAAEIIPPSMLQNADADAGQ